MKLSYLTEYLHASSRILWTGKLLVSVVLPIIEALLVNKATGSENPTPYIWTLAAIGIIHLVLALIVLFEPQAPIRLVLDHDETVTKLNTSVKREQFVETLAIAYDQTISAACASGIIIEDLTVKPETDLGTAFSKVLTPWISGRSEIFLYTEGNALYNFAVYMIDGSGKTLNIVYRSHDNRLAPKNRSWQVGDGHVGMCFVRQQILFLNHPDGEELPSALRTTQPRDEDRIYYRSLVAAPIFVDQEINGVFVITSNIPNQFVESVHQNIVDLVSRLLAQAYKYCWNAGI